MATVPYGAARSGEDPRWSYRDVERRTLGGTAVVLLGLAAAAWWVTVDRAGGMTSMVDGLADVGRAMPFEMGAALFFSMWTAMMVAMMFPTVAPVVAVHRMVMRRRGTGRLPTIVFAGGYLAVWVFLGIVPFLVLVGFRQVAEPSAWVARGAGAVLVVAGAYQFSRWKDTCLRACRSPLTFLATHDFGGGHRAAARVGASHGLYCAGCCWALMAVLFVVGLMNLVWMAVLTVVFLAEKVWRHGVALTRVVGTTLVVTGIAVLVEPSLLEAVAGGTGPGRAM
ncbi:DUF2182 domain-containing protein [Geodermatophilus sp. SYSU D00758]